MSYFATIKCKKCGKLEQIYLGGYGFSYRNNITKCKYCGYEYNAEQACITMEDSD